MSTTPAYPTDLTEAQWTLLLTLLPPRCWQPGGPGRPPCALRPELQGILSLLKPGWQGPMVPRAVGKGTTLYAYCKAWRAAGVWAGLRAAWRPLERNRPGRQPAPAAGSGESQRIKTATQPPAVGFDGGKQVKGRNRQGGVDTLGLLSAVGVTAAHTDDRGGGLGLVTHYFLGGGRR
jgi:putative transposase